MNRNTYSGKNYKITVVESKKSRVSPNFTMVLETTVETKFGNIVFTNYSPINYLDEGFKEWNMLDIDTKADIDCERWRIIKVILEEFEVNKSKGE